MSELHHASEAIYHPIPQAPVASNAVPASSPDDLDDDVVLSEPHSVPSQGLIDSRIRWIHFVLGCAVLLPWNALINATPYFLSRVADTPLKSSFSSYLSTTFTAANFGFLAHATATAKKASNTRRVLYSLIALAVLNFFLTFSTYTHPTPGGFFAFVLLNAIGQAAAGSYLQTAVVAIASLFGPSAMQAVMSGQAAVAVVISGVQVVSSLASVRGSEPATTVASSEPEEKSAFIFFGMSTVFLLASVGVNAWLVSLPAYKAVTSQRSTRRLSTAEGTSLLAASAADDVHDLRKPERENHVVRLAKTNATFNVAVAYVFIVTLAVFPPITISIKSTNPSVHPLVFSAAHFLMFNTGDIVGRAILSFHRFHIWTARRLLTLSLLRTLFIPLFLMCNIQWGSGDSSSGPIIGSDVLFMLLMVCFGLTNGYVSSMCMMAAPSLAHNPRLEGRAEDVDVAATVAGFCLVGGLAVGSIVSFAVRATVCDCNPFTQ
ncbi:hypothetical protein V8D89_011441 [Ganoderma adspersum]